jgi:hypothetical protein
MPAPSLPSRRVMPVEMRSSDTVCFRTNDVIGTTETPFSPIRKGYSFVPCSVPRYFRMRSRRVEVCWMTRWSSTITQSETYSSMPEPGEGAFAALDGKDGRDAAFLQPAEQPAQFGPYDRRAQPHEQRLQIPVAGPGHVGRDHVDVIENKQSLSLELGKVETERGDVRREVVGGFLEGDAGACLGQLREGPRCVRWESDGIQRGSSGHEGSPNYTLSGVAKARRIREYHFRRVQAQIGHLFGRLGSERIGQIPAR